MINVAEDWNNTATGSGAIVFIYRAAFGMVNFNGAATQTISGTTSHFENLTINNTAAGQQ
jgi:hypothetical protein